VKIQVFRVVNRRPLLNVYRCFDSRSPVVLDSLTLQLSSYNTSKSWWLPTSWLNDVTPQKTWIRKNIAVITRKVASKHYCLLQVLVATLLLVSVAAFVKRYPDPLDCKKYYLRIDDKFYHRTCPNNLTFNQYAQQCTLDSCTDPNITPLFVTNCNQGMEGYYCESMTNFTYCTHDGLKIINNAMCPSPKYCLGPRQPNPCVL
jgi:hypothetical protein